MSVVFVVEASQRCPAGESEDRRRRTVVGEDEDVDDPPADVGFRAGVVVGLDQPHLSAGVLVLRSTLGS